MSAVSMTYPQMRRRECAVGDRIVKLMPVTSNLLTLLLMTGPDRFVSSDEIIDELWPNPNTQPEFIWNNVYRHVSILRRAGIAVEHFYRWGYRIPRAARGSQPAALKLAA